MGFPALEENMGWDGNPCGGGEQTLSWCFWGCFIPFSPLVGACRALSPPKKAGWAQVSGSHLGADGLVWGCP